MKFTHHFVIDRAELIRLYEDSVASNDTLSSVRNLERYEAPWLEDWLGVDRVSIEIKKYYMLTPKGEEYEERVFLVVEDDPVLAWITEFNREKGRG